MQQYYAVKLPVQMHRLHPAMTARGANKIFPF